MLHFVSVFADLTTQQPSQNQVDQYLARYYRSLVSQIFLQSHLFCQVLKALVPADRLPRRLFIEANVPALVCRQMRRLAVPRTPFPSDAGDDVAGVKVRATTPRGSS